MAKERQSQLNIVEDEDRISSWLRDTTLNEYSDDADKFDNTTTIDPTTPRRRPLLRECYDELSPTSTSFSDGSIFDAPHSPVDGWIEDVFDDDDIPARATSDDFFHHLDVRKSGFLPQVQTESDRPEIESQISYDPPSDVAADDRKTFGSPQETSKTAAPPPLDTKGPRPTWLTSCLQCIHADLPCSRKAPACSRCKRNGEAALCLLHRRPYPDEILKSDASWSTTLKLLRLEGEDDEVWKGKLQMTNELQTRWRTEKDYRNWVLPAVDSPRGNFRSDRAGTVEAYPGEGRGERKERFSYQELSVVMND